MKIINPEAVVSQTKNENDEIIKLVIKKELKLGQVIDKLPNGIIHKHQTGIGATTLELESQRNSIIVEPLKVTASTKAYKYRTKAPFVAESPSRASAPIGIYYVFFIKQTEL